MPLDTTARRIPLAEGYYIFYAGSNENKGPELVAKELILQIREAAKDWDIEYLSNAKIDADSGGQGREMFFGFQCVVLRHKAMKDAPRPFKKEN